MSCIVCLLPADRKRLLETLYNDGEKTVEELGASFRIDYDVIQVHVTSHMQATSDHTTRTEQVLDELQDMVEVSRQIAESEPSPDSIKTYNATVKLYHDISMDLKDRREKELAANKEAQAIVDAVVISVLNPMLSETAKIVVSELAKLRDVLTRSGNSANISAHFDETTRRLGTQLNESLSPHIDTLQQCVNGFQKKKKKP